MGMKSVHQVADAFRVKLAQQMSQRPMRGPGGDPKKPDLENVVKNIEDLIRGFNYLASKVKTTGQANQAATALEESGVTVTP